MKIPSNYYLMRQNNPPAPAPTAASSKKMVTTKKKKTSDNFDNQFLIDFRLHPGEHPMDNGKIIRDYEWIFSKKAAERFHTPVTYSNPHGPEDRKHYLLKTLVHDYIYDNYYLENECRFFVTSELEQKSNCFWSHLDGRIPVFFTLDICIIREDDWQVFNVEIDGPEHYTRGGIMKADIRDTWLNDRYGVLTLRIDKNDDTINYKRLDKFINSPAVPNPRKKPGRKVA